MYFHLETFTYCGLGARLGAVCSCSMRSTLTAVLPAVQQFISAVLHHKPHHANTNDIEGRGSARMQSNCQINIYSAEQVRLVPFSAVVENILVISKTNG